MKVKNYYKILGVSPQASQDAIKQAYRRLARKYHPDVSALPNAEDHFKEIGEAYEVLKDPAKRVGYEAFYRGRSAGNDSTRSGTRPASQSTTQQRSDGTQRMTMNGFGPILFFVIGAFMLAHFHSSGDYQTSGIPSDPAKPISVEVQDVSGSERVNTFVRSGRLSDHETS